MENRKWGSALIARPGARPAPPSILYFPFSVFLVLLVFGGCASPGEPTERKPPVPRAVTDLAARQSGNEVVLTFTLPKETLDQRPLEQPPAIEIYRDFEAPSGAGETRAAAPAIRPLLVTIPAVMVDRYTERNQVRYTDSLQASDFTGHPGAVAVYTVRTSASAKKTSPDSNVAVVRVYPAPDPIADVKAEVTHRGIVLTWTPPQATPAGPAPPIVGYRVYRGEVEPGATGPASATPAASATPPHEVSQATPGHPTLKEPLAKIGESDSATFRDTQTEFGKTYLYSVRSFVDYSGAAVESADSTFAVVTLRDAFPPAAPQGLVVVWVPEHGDGPAHLDLSWAVSTEADVAGYNVYRSEQVGILGTRLNTELLLTPAFRDINVMPGHRYFYSVTAVDRSGNEGPSSAIVSGGAPAESQPTP